MVRQCDAYEWTERDKWVYLLVLTPFLVAFVGAAVLMATISIHWAITLIALYLLGNFFQAGCCIGCPYRGRYCPALFGIFFANRLSARIYGNRDHDERFFNRNAVLAAAVVVVIGVLCVSLLFTIHWAYAVAFLSLSTAHVVVFFRAICPKCGFNETCPGGRWATRGEGTS
jgi:hypothetical protein